LRRLRVFRRTHRYRFSIRRQEGQRSSRFFRVTRRLTRHAFDSRSAFNELASIRPFPRGTELDEHDYVVRDGIVVIPKNTTLPAGTIIAPQ
jgi:hypothetical protein